MIFDHLPDFFALGGQLDDISFDQNSKLLSSSFGV
jgi:hypothetical protein